MTQLALHDEHPAHRHLRMLGADLVFRTPVVARAGPQDRRARWPATPTPSGCWRAGELVGVLPEGFKGIGKPFSERYKLQRFGRGGFVSAALRTGRADRAGARSSAPRRSTRCIGNVKTLARLLGLPYFPVTPTFPLARAARADAAAQQVDHRVRRADPDRRTTPTGAADDPMLVFNLTDQVRETIQQTLYKLLMQRRSVFF